MTAQIWIVLVGWFVVLMAIAVALVQYGRVRRRVGARLAEQARNEHRDLTRDEPDWLTNWLFVSGFRGPRAVWGYFGLTGVSFALGLLVALLLYRMRVVRVLVETVGSLPGGVGEVLLPIVYAAPFFVLFTLAALPTLVVRARQRRRVRQIEQDLPIVLELLATLAQVGLALDGAIARVLESLPARHVLAQELRAFQRDNLAGRARVDSLRWLERRVSVPWFSIFISAVVQAEQVGAGLAEVLGVQAEDLRQRRKEQALALASSTPVKLLVPLIVCFMPAIFTASLGPTLFEIFQMLDSITQNLRPQ